MDRSMIVFWAGMMLVIAVFIPIALLQDSGQSARIAKRGGKRKWTPLDEPHPVKVRFTCMQRRKKAYGSLDGCQVLCPSSVPLSNPMQQKALLRCYRGKWTALRDKKPRSLARRSVSLVEQQSASPEVLNNLLNHYLNHSQNYLDMAYFFDRADVQLPGFHHYLMGLWQGSMDRARSVMGYINKRGGWIDIKDLPSPTMTDALIQGQRSGYMGLVAMEAAVAMETESERLVLNLVESVENSENTDDPHLLHTLEDRYLDVHVRQVKELMDHVTQLRVLQEAGQEDYSLGEYQMDSLLK